MRLRLLLVLVLIASLRVAGMAQGDVKPHAAGSLADYGGTFRSSAGVTIEVVAAGRELFAILDEAKYRLRLDGQAEDVALNPSGQKIPFRRDATGRVTGLMESGVWFERTSDAVSAPTMMLMRARPAGEDAPDAYRYHVPEDRHDGLAVGDIAQSELGVGTAEAIVRGVLDGRYRDVHSVLLYQHGKLVMEEYFYGYNVERTHQLRSATKTVVGAMAGIAVDEGLIAGVDEPAMPHLGYREYANPDARKAKITLGNLLSMSSGLDCNDHSSDSPGRETVIDEQPDWVKATMDLPMLNDPGTKAFYCSGGVSVVGRWTENAAHRKLPDFAQEKLFGPLGIARGEWSWNYDLTNADREYSQIHLRPRGMLKLGILYAGGGMWKGKRVISEGWVKSSLGEESRVDGTSYGYFWWRPWMNVAVADGNRRVDFVAAQGNGGQKIYLLPQFDLVAVFTAGDYNSQEGAPPNRIMGQIVFPRLLEGVKARTAGKSGAPDL